MARDLNKWQGIGRLGADPEVRFTTTGKTVCNFSIVTTDSWTDKETGEKKQQTEWHKIVAYDKLAEILAEYAKKGARIYVEGKLVHSQWEDKEGNKKTAAQIIVSFMQLLEKKTRSESDSDVE